MRVRLATRYVPRPVRILRSMKMLPSACKEVQVAADADLVGDHGGVLGVGLALAAVALGDTVDSVTGDAVHELVVVEEDADDQSGSAVGRVNAPGHFVPRGQDIGEEFGLVVGDASGQQPVAALVDRDAVVSLACVDAGSDVRAFHDVSGRRACPGGGDRQPLSSSGRSHAGRAGAAVRGRGTGPSWTVRSLSEVPQVGRLRRRRLQSRKPGATPDRP